MNNKSLVIIILVLFLLVAGIIGAYFMMNNNNKTTDNINETIKNSTSNLTNDSQNITNNSQVESSNNISNSKINNNAIAKGAKNNLKSQNTTEPILITKKQAISITNGIVSYPNILGEKVGNTATLTKVNKKHYWVVPVYNKTNGLKTTEYYIDAKTGHSTDPARLGAGF